MTPLHFAADYGRLDVAKFLVESGADLHAMNKARSRSATPLACVLAAAFSPAASPLLCPSSPLLFAPSPPSLSFSRPTACASGCCAIARRGQCRERECTL